MGAKQSPDVAQEIMESVLGDLDKTDSWSDHLTSLRKVLTLLQQANFTIDPLKRGWAVQEMDWLGCWISPTGPTPWCKKIDAILSMQAPQTVKQSLPFVGAVTFCHDVFP
jgi:hypothetical protein